MTIVLAIIRLPGRSRKRKQPGEWSIKVNDTAGEKWCPAWESNSQRGLTSRNSLILRKTKTEKNDKNTEVRYMAGTRPLQEPGRGLMGNLSRFEPQGVPPPPLLSLTV